MNLHKTKVIIFDRKKTYQECADAIGISIGAFNKKMNGVSKFTVPEFKALADFLKMSNSEQLDILNN